MHDGILLYEKEKKSFQHCSYVKVIKIFDKVLSKSCIGNFDVFRKDFVLFFSSVQVPVRRCCVYTAVDMFTIKQTLLCFGAAGSLDMQIVIDTLTPWDEETFRKSKPFPFSQQRRFFGIFLKTFLLKLAMHNPPCMLHRIALCTFSAYHCVCMPVFKPLTRIEVELCFASRATYSNFWYYLLLGFLGCIFSSLLFR